MDSDSTRGDVVEESDDAPGRPSGFLTSWFLILVAAIVYVVLVGLFLLGAFPLLTDGS